LKNAHLLRCPRPSSLNVRQKYASLLGMSGALPLGIFEQPTERSPKQFCFEIACTYKQITLESFEVVNYELNESIVEISRSIAISCLDFLGIVSFQNHLQFLKMSLS